MSRASDASTTAERSSVHCVDDRALPVLDRVRQPHPPAVEDDHTTERTQPVEQASEPGLLLEQLEREEPTRHHHDVARGFGRRLRVEDPVRDLRSVVGLGVETSTTTPSLTPDRLRDTKPAAQRLPQAAPATHEEVAEAAS